MSSEWFKSKIALAAIDFDGTLVNTEEVHFAAYKRMLESRKCTLPWTFATYSLNAHFTSEGLESAIRAQCPSVAAEAWESLYADKKKAFLQLVEEEGDVQLMQDVDKLLEALATADCTRCVVTNSPQPLIDSIRKLPHNAALDSIPVWYTRGKYTHGKPHPECYVRSIIDMLPSGSIYTALRGGGDEAGEARAVPDDTNVFTFDFKRSENIGGEKKLIVLGFEDTPRGLRSLLEARRLFGAHTWHTNVVVVPIFISSIEYEGLDEFVATTAIPESVTAQKCDTDASAVTVTFDARAIDEAFADAAKMRKHRSEYVQFDTMDQFLNSLSSVEALF